MDRECFLVYDSYRFSGRDFMVLACFGAEDRRLLYIRFFDESDRSLVGNVYVARVEKRIAGIGVFLVTPDSHVFVREKDSRAVVYIKRQSQKKELSQGDLVLVQIERDAIKSKEPLGGFVITIKTPYFLLKRPGEGISFSKRLSASDRERLSTIRHADGALLLRTAAGEADPVWLKQAIGEAGETLDGILADGANHTGPALVWQDNDLLNRLMSAFPFARNHLFVSRIISSDKSVCDRLGEISRLYQDQGLGLLDLYRIRTITDDLLKKEVWLRSGANIVIEQTEAFTVIDVNSAKAGRSDAFSINMEAAREIMTQIRLRNISGIIITDFMKMDSDQQRSSVMSVMRQMGQMDFARVTVEGFTRLGLLEMTREKLFASVNQTLTGRINYDTISSVDAQ
ncbi:MAG: ribonuclease E/G [Lachnospiraceae bacterium]|nr:ribonuclease E/G [Lachnospiraceae bacterium]